MMTDILEQIVARKKERLITAKLKLPPAELMSILPTSIGSGRFIDGFKKEGVKIIAEIKRSSPSKGIIRENFDPVAIARNYTGNGATAISCLTEEDFFDGSLEYLRAVRDVTTLPLLRKDFIFDEYQLMEASYAGADAVLLIASMLEEAQLNNLLQSSNALGLDALVEIHDRDELDKVMRYDVKILGINNRNLRTFETTLDTSIALAKELPRSVTLISESGIHTREDIDRLSAAGFDGFLIGEQLMRAPDEGKALRDLIGV